MIASIKTQTQILSRDHQEQFLEMVPQIRRKAIRAFRRLQHEHRNDMVQEVIANAFCNFVRLVQRGRAGTAFATPIASFAIRQAIEGRRVGSSSRLCDVTSPFARSARGVRVERLDSEGSLRAALVEDRRAGPADIAAARIDVAAWLSAMSDSHRRIAKALAIGDTTSDVARQFGLSSARISQIRSLLKENWERFHQRGSEAREPCVAT